MCRNLFDQSAQEQHHRFVLVVMVTGTYLGSAPLAKKQLQDIVFLGILILFVTTVNKLAI